MSIQRYKALNGYGGDADLAKDNGGEIVLFTDHLEDVRQQLFHLLSTLADIRRESGVGEKPMLSELAGEIGKLKAERDDMETRLGIIERNTQDNTARSLAQNTLAKINGGQE